MKSRKWARRRFAFFALYFGAWYGFIYELERWLRAVIHGG